MLSTGQWSSNLQGTCKDEAKLTENYNSLLHTGSGELGNWSFVSWGWLKRQITGEIKDLFHFIEHVYKIFGLNFFLKLSTRPEKYLGEIETWDMAEAKLKEALDDYTTETKRDQWELNEGDGAFYGPKIDIVTQDG